MKIAFPLPGTVEFPPDGYQPAVQCVWNLKNELEKQGHDVHIILFKKIERLIELLEEGEYDFIHFHIETVFMQLNVIRRKFSHTPVAVTSHYPYLNNPRMRKKDGIEPFYQWSIRNNRVYNIAVRDSDAALFESEGANQYRQLTMSLGVSRSIRFDPFPEKKSKTLCLGGIHPNRRQFLLQELPVVDLVGPVIDDMAFKRGKNYLGVWSRKKLESFLTSYGNFIYINTRKKSTPLSIKEALCAGLGVVTTKNCAKELDTDLPFIDIIDDDIIGDMETLYNLLEMNRNISSSMREDIRQYGKENFSWPNVIQDYEETITSLIKKHGKTQDTQTTTGEDTDLGSSTESVEREDEDREGEDPTGVQDTSTDKDSTV